MREPPSIFWMGMTIITLCCFLVVVDSREIMRKKIQHQQEEIAALKDQVNELKDKLRAK